MTNQPTEELLDRWSPPDLSEHVALVTGASYGVGRGVAETLGGCGATVYVTGRSSRARPSGPHRFSVEETAEAVSAAGGHGVGVGLDHNDEAAVHALVARIRDEAGQLSVLVNNVWAWGPMESYLEPTWDQPMARWDDMMGTAIRGQFMTTRHALPLMIDSGGGLIAFTQERPGDESHFGINLVVDLAATTQKRMAAYLGRELAPKQIAVVQVYLGWVRSVNMLEGLQGDTFSGGGFTMSRAEFMRRTQSPHFAGRGVAMLAADPQRLSRTGGSFYAGELAEAFGFTDTDGRRPSVEESM